MLLSLDAILLEGFFAKPSELILVLVVILIFFGGKKIPELMRGLGQGIREFKDASKPTDPNSPKKTEDTTTSSTSGQIK